MNKVFALLAIISVCLVGFAVAHDDHDHDHDHEEEVVREELSYVTCGSVIKLRHVATGFRLHSHGVNYGSGSGQQSVTTFPGKDDTNSYWVVRGNSKAGYCKTGDKIKNGGTIRLQHLNTKKNLHSHLHPSPLTNQQEVSAYGEHGVGDTGDDWKVELASGTHWKRGETVKFKHVDTGKYLQSNKNQYRNPIPGQQEVACTTNKDHLIEWASEEGIYFPSDFADK